MTTILLPPLPRMTHYGGEATVLTAGDLRARDIKVARLMLEAAAQACFPCDTADECADEIRNLEVKHHE